MAKDNSQWGFGKNVRPDPVNLSETNDRQYKMCKRKKVYKTRAQAMKYIRSLGEPLRTYECPYCSSWHLTRELRK